MTEKSSLAFGVIRKGAIPNPSIGRKVARTNNPKEILGIIVNPDESKPKAKRGSTMKKKRKSPARPKAKRAASSRSASGSRRAKKVSTPAATRRKKVRRRNPSLQVGYEVPSRESNARPKKRKATAKRRKTSSRKASAKGKMSAAQVRNLLRSVAKRIKNSSASPARGRTTVGQRSGLSASGFGATEVRRAGLLDGASRIETLDNEIANLNADLQSATDDVLRGLYARELASKITERENLLGGLGFLDAAIIGGKSKELKNLRDSITMAALERREQAASRALAASKFRGIDKRRNDYYAAFAIAVAGRELLEASSGGPLVQETLSLFPALGKKFQAFDPSGVPVGTANLTFENIFKNADRYESETGKTALLMLPKEAIHEAIRMLHRNFLPNAGSSAGAAKLHAKLSMTLDRLHGILEGRIENPRRRRGSKKRKAGSRKRRRVSNPRKKRRSGKKSSYKKRSKKRGRRRRNPRGSELIARLVSGQASIGDMLKVGVSTVGGYVLVGAGEWALQALGVDKMLSNLAGSSAQAGSALTAAGAGAATALLVWGLGKASQTVQDLEAPLYVGIASRVVVNLIDSFARTPSEATKLIRSAAGLPPTVGGYGRWNPNMDGYYNFQPVMAGRSAASRAGYSVGNYANKAGYSAPAVNGYYNLAPSMGGYANFAPKLNKNPFGNPFGRAF